jgi:hypothetical protein
MTTYFDPDLNALGYPRIRDIPETLTNAERAARHLQAESGSDAERQIAAIRGVGYALLALAEKEPATTAPTAPPQRSRFRRFFA